ncbi:hypothetical protein HYU50_01795 [Candidatus Woesearchaeota archaeon]|nr:hypothetical protein [Candidatus Woesearchaeota archaeon]
MSCIDNLLIEIIAKNFFELKQKKKLKRKTDRLSFGLSISNIIINSSIKMAKQSKTETVKKEKDFDGNIGEKTWDKNGVIANGGYGTISKHYGISPVVKYLDYNKLFSYLGAFRAKSMYEGLESNSIDWTANNGDESTRQMVGKETMEKAAKHFKYFVMGDVIGDIGFVPPFGANVDSKEWEKYRLMTKMSIYQPLLAIKRATA